MARPGIIPGGVNLFASGTTLSSETDDLLTSVFGSTTANAPPQSNIGVFSANPGATPKYALNRGPRNSHEFPETMARMFLTLPKGQTRNFVQSLPNESKSLGRVLAAGGASAGAKNTGFIDFLLTGTQETFQEKAQIVDTLTDNYVAFYAGQAPPVFGYSGVVLNTYQDDQRVWMLRAYRDMLRGTKLANRNLSVSLRYDSFIITGYMESLSLSLDGAAQNYGNFQFTLRVRRVHVFTDTVGLPTVASRISLALPSTQEQAEEKIEALTARSASGTTEEPPTAVAKPAAADPTPSRDVKKDAIQEHKEEVTKRIDAASGAKAQSVTLGSGVALPSPDVLTSIDNATNDGSSGITNIKNAPRGMVEAAEQITPRVPPKPRGIRHHDAARVTITKTTTASSGTLFGFTIDRKAANKREKELVAQGEDRHFARTLAESEQRQAALKSQGQAYKHVRTSSTR